MVTERQTKAEAAAAAACVRRVVLLGASNVARGISTVFETSRLLCGGPIELLAAIGRGRSYGVESSMCGRRLPGILNCGLWPALDQRPPAPTVALITDIGNDILYGIPVPRIAHWIESCINRLQTRNAQLVMTLLPMENVLRLTPARFRLARRLLFPGNHLSLEEVRSRAIELNARVEELGRSRGIRLIEQRSSWYGIDPIHIHIRSWKSAWGEILGAWPNVQLSKSPKRSFFRWLNLSLLPPERRVICGFQQQREQPVARWRDGTTISLY